MRYLIVLLFIIVGSHVSLAQSQKLQAMEEELVFIQNTTNRIWQYVHNTSYNNSDDFRYDEIINLLCKQFDIMLNQMLIEDKDMSYPFTNLQNDGLLEMHITWSADSLLRVFSWLLPSGTQHIYGNTIQYKNANSIVCSFPFDNEYNNQDTINDMGSNYDAIYILKNKNIYILSGATMAQTMYPTYQLRAYSINDNLVLENIFEDKNGNIENMISVGYDIGCSNIDENNFPRPSVDEGREIMYLLEIDGNCFSGKLLKYKFDGEKFRFNFEK